MADDVTIDDYVTRRYNFYKRSSNLPDKDWIRDHMKTSENSINCFIERYDEKIEYAKLGCFYEGQRDLYIKLALLAESKKNDKQKDQFLKLARQYDELCAKQYKSA